MPAPYSEDLRMSVIEGYKKGGNTQKEIALLFGVSLVSFKRYWAQYKKTGSVAPIFEKSGRPPAITKDGMDQVKSLVEKHEDATLSELCGYYNRNRKKKVGVSIMHRALKSLGFRRKKKSCYASQRDREDIKK